MNKKTPYLLSAIVAAVLALGLFAAPAAAEPSAEELRQTIRDYIHRQEKRHGAFLILDERGEVNRRLSLVRVHERVGKTGDYYYSCTDMKDLGSGDELDLDFDISDQAGDLKVVDIRIHKDNGQARYTYDDNDNMIPLS
ncbi:MAG: hypothetical protein ACI9Y8_002065 [Candidatus Omnitrophota bacterium]|jgi:hypothetical protein